MSASINWHGYTCTVTAGVWSCPQAPILADILNIDSPADGGYSPSIANPDFYEATLAADRYPGAKLVDFTPTPAIKPGLIY